MSPRHTKAIGLMSGTSADGITAALVDVSARGVRVIRFKTYPFNARLKAAVRGAAQLSVGELSRLNYALGAQFGRAAKAILRGDSAVVVGSHGQTVWYAPDADPPNTLQIAEPAVIAEITGLTVVADFRPRDMAAGGLGAPLVPAFDVFLFGRGARRAVLNIGGIANISIVGGGTLRAAFDTGPGNCAMDCAMRAATNGQIDLDRGGKLAAIGCVDEGRLRRMLNHPYFKRRPPKSLDYSTFGPDFAARFYPRLNNRNLPDALATFAELTARTIAAAAKSRGPVAELIVSGGGALNAHLMRRLSALMSPTRVTTTAQYGLPVMAKEAACFAWLGARALERKPNHAPAGTGARGPRILGKITPKS